jgi:hypothetical protein
VRPGPAVGQGLLSGAAAQAGTAAERRNGVQRKGKEIWYGVARSWRAFVPVKAFEARTKQEDVVAEKGAGRIWVNRVFAFLIGAVLIYAVMSLSVVKNVKAENAELKKELYDPGKLLTSAKELFGNRNYSEATKTLDTLFEKHPGASEVAEGKQLYAEVEAEQNALDKKWEAAVGAIREEWATKMAAQLRATSEKDRVTMETNMNDLLNTEWDKMKDKIREEWEKQK